MAQAGLRRTSSTPVLLNVYDLSSANEFTYSFGLGVHHSGVEVNGTEYTFASGVGEFEGFSLPSFGGDGENAITYEDVKKFGVSGTIAYVLTELAFWAVAFPVAAALFTQANGHAPDLFNSGEDRAAVIASIFVGANVARLAVPLRFGVALAAAPWVDENIVQRFGGDSVDVEAVVEEEPVAVEEEKGFSMPELPTFKNPFE